MKRNIFAAVLLCLALVTLSSATVSGNPPDMPGMFANARFVYVAAYEGGQFDPRLLPEDRDAIGRVQTAIQKWGKLIVVYRPQDADMILLVESRPSEDVLALYDAHGGDAGSRPSQMYLWRVMGRGGLQKGEMPLVSQFEKAWDKIAH
ncbi:MAG: hypothetical protein WCF68_07510 [Terriglobales bacterium]